MSRVIILILWLISSVPLAFGLFLGRMFDAKASSKFTPLLLNYHASYCSQDNNPYIVPTREIQWDVSTMGPRVNITWDIIRHTRRGYEAIVTLYDHEHPMLPPPNWILGWKWLENQVIWELDGGNVSRKGDCSSFKEEVPISCSDSPVVVDIARRTIRRVSTGLDKQIGSAFRIHVGATRKQNNKRSYYSYPRTFTLKSSRLIFSCGPPKVVKSTTYENFDYIKSEAISTLSLQCVYSEMRMTERYNMTFSEARLWWKILDPAFPHTSYPI